MYTDAVRLWYDYYRDITGEEYIMDGKQGAHLKQLLKKIKTKVRQKGMEDTEESILNSLSGFLAHIDDQWILDNLDISIVNSKFNVIYSKAVRNSPFASSERLDSLIDQRYGNAGDPG